MTAVVLLNSMSDYLLNVSHPGSVLPSTLAGETSVCKWSSLNAETQTVNVLIWWLLGALNGTPGKRKEVGAVRGIMLGGGRGMAEETLCLKAVWSTQQFLGQQGHT